LFFLDKYKLTLSVKSDIINLQYHSEIQTLPFGEKERAMKHVTTTIAVVFIIITACAPIYAQQPAGPKEVTGTWKGTQTTEDGRQRPATLTIKEDGTWEVRVEGRNRVVIGIGTFRVENGQYIWKSSTTVRTGKWTLADENRLISVSDDGERRGEFSRQ
jgi:hypothetical protein